MVRGAIHERSRAWEKGEMSQSGGQVRRIDAVRWADRFWWVSTPQGVPHGIDRGGAVYKGRGEEMVIRVGARQIKALTTPNCLICAEGEFGAAEEKMINAVNGDKTHSE